MQHTDHFEPPGWLFSEEKACAFRESMMKPWVDQIIEQNKQKEVSLDCQAKPNSFV